MPRIRPTVPAVLLAVFAFSPVSLRAESKHLALPEGFTATLFADDDLCNNVYTLTHDALGRVVVSGPGYVRILHDDDGDGRADRFTQFANGPRSGAQGLYFHGRDLICTGDGGLIRYRDTNADDRADGPAEVFLKMKTGGEHDVHSVQRGPDGWWYLIAGNYSGVGARYSTLSTSPIPEPEDGVVLRLRPNLNGGEIVADGFRNAYDFAFDTRGDVHVYDSDGERDVSLPWYRPTRVFQALPGSHAGWVSRSWKRPGTFPDMPPVMGAFGRGSPTGVVCYRHTAFPPKYRGAVFALDWTFGRIVCLPLEPAGSVWKSAAFEFATGKGLFGFAPTDAAVGPDGSLYVSVGGRGTRGGVYRITWTGDPTAKRADDDSLDAILTAPQPLASWSRARWAPAARKLGKEAILAAALDTDRPPEQRTRAIEILTNSFGGVTAESLDDFRTHRSAEVRARAVWSYGRSNGGKVDPDALAANLADVDPLVKRFALEALLTASEVSDFEELRELVGMLLGDDDRQVRITAARVVQRFPKQLDYSRTSRGRLYLELGRTLRSKAVRPASLRGALDVIERDRPIESKRDAARLGQLALGDVGNREGEGHRDAVFDGYTARTDLAPNGADLAPLRERLRGLLPSGDAELDRELGRLQAMLGDDDGDALARTLANITDDSHPTDDVHHLIVAATNRAPRTNEQVAHIAAAFVSLDAKLAERGLNVDNNWEPRIGELYAAHLRLDADRRLPLAIVEADGFGLPGHVPYIESLSARHRQRAVDAIATRAGAEDYQWSSDVVHLLGESARSEHVELIRGRFENYGVRNAVLQVLAARADVDDRERFAEGLETSQLATLRACVAALGKLPLPAEDEAAAENVALVRTIRRLGAERNEFAIRERVVALLERNAGREFGFTAGEEGHRPQPEAIGRMTTWVTETHPEAARTLAAGGEDEDSLRQRLDDIDWNAGDAERGRVLYNRRGCIQCHGGSRSLGPDLAGLSKRFGRFDRFRAIAFPNRDVPPRYQPTLIVTTEGTQHAGLIVYESVDGVVLRDGNNRTFRIESSEIEVRRRATTSLMPTGLLKDLGDLDLADLDAYLRSLR